jgi:hypothetical protein
LQLALEPTNRYHEAVAEAAYDKKGEFTATHCINSNSPTFDGDQWVVSETLVLSQRIELQELLPGGG